MQFIKDTQGRTWEININFDAIKRVKADLKIDLGMAKYPGASGAPLMVELYESPMAMLDVLWSLCRLRASELRVKRDEFDEGFFGPELDAAKAAFFEEWENFFQKLGRAEDQEMISNFLKLMPRTSQEALEAQRRELTPVSSDSASSTLAS